MKLHLSSVLFPLLLLVGLVGCSPTSPTPPPPDATPPTLVSSVPTKNAQSVAVGNNLSLTFSKAMNKASLSTTLSPSANLGTPTWIGDNTVQFDPPADLAAGTSYQLSVSAQDTLGNTLQAGTLEFTTAPTGEPTGNGATGVPNERTRALDAAGQAALKEVRSDGSLVFSSTGGSVGNLKVGDIVASVPTPAAPYGLLRTVTGVRDEDGTRVLETRQAKINEAFDEIDLTLEQVLGPEDVLSEEFLTPGVTLSARSRNLLSPQVSKSFDLTFDKVFFDSDGNSNTKTDQVKASGSVNLTFTLTTKVTRNILRFKVNVAEESKLKFDANVNFSGQKTIRLKRINFKPITFFIGPVPVVIVPRLDLELRMSGEIVGTMSFEAVQNLNATAGVEYKNSKWNNLSEVTSDFNSPVGNAGASLKAKAGVAAKAEALLYGVVGAFIEIEPNLQLDAVLQRNPLWILKGCIDANAGVEIDLWVLERKYQTQIFSRCAEYARSINQAPTLEFTSPVQGTSVQIGVNTGINVRAIDLEDGTSCCSVTFRSSVDGPLGSAPSNGSTAQVGYTFTTLGPRTLTATTSDSSGKAATAQITINVVNTAPTVSITAPSSGSNVFRGSPLTLRGTSYDPNEPNQTLECSSLRWTSNVSADETVTGCTASLTFSSVGPRTLTLTGADSQGATGTATVSLTVVDPPPDLPPTVRITAPANNASVGPSQDLTLSATASDPEGKVVTVNWTVSSSSSKNGPWINTKTIGAGATRTWKPDSSYPRSFCEANYWARLQASGTDPAGGSGQDLVVINVIQIC